MKKYLFLLLVLLITCGSAFAFDILSYPPPINGGNIMVDAGIGLTAYGSTYGTIAIPPVFFNMEYALPVGAPISVGGFGAFYRYNYRVVGNSGWQYTFFTFGGRADWHWGFDLSWLDLYSGVWIGYRVFMADWVGSGSGYTAPGYGGFDFGFQAGAHVYFSNNFGVVLESGYPFALKIGAALKFNGKQGDVKQGNQRGTGGTQAKVAGTESFELMILRLAKEHKGILTVSDVALEARIPMEDAKRHLDDMVRKGFAEQRTRKNGSQVYIILDMLDEPLGEAF